MKQVVVMFARLSAVDQLRELAEAELLQALCDQYAL
jgi:hypothetical protein